MLRRAVLVVLTRATWRNIPEDDILHSHRRGNLKSYMDLFPSSEEGRETPTLRGPSERPNLNNWTMCFIDFRTMDKIQKRGNSYPIVTTI
jgi:hypothetical protein